VPVSTVRHWIATKQLTSFRLGRWRLVPGDRIDILLRDAAGVWGAAFSPWRGVSVLYVAPIRALLNNQAFEEGTNCVIVATSALELGIDVGDLDHVIQIDAPSSVSSFLQRMGRTGRRAGSTANCTFLATDDDALLRAAAIIDLFKGLYRTCCAVGLVATCARAPGHRAGDAGAGLGNARLVDLARRLRGISQGLGVRAGEHCPPYGRQRHPRRG
jgi:hypothetical protein